MLEGVLSGQWLKYTTNQGALTAAVEEEGVPAE